ncbi:hypothetical protein EDB81DRAFT_889385 [Dactylonectria macrodidyma]|uniref:Uncharacterized protein n=1 Tax=Dactylonectria macrodidyma TaxID=307937 RepID=A0A9P9DYX1_9HYPO|nr:hypothetical protein EDB81DRAFT_889385 [Dactylonectria macrodidyma]
MAWKRFSIDQAEAVSHGLEDEYLRLRIAQSKSFISRISGDMEDAASSLGDLSQFRVESLMNRRIHAAIGQAAIQQSLNYILVDELSPAKAVVEGWSPVDQNPSSLEKAVPVRKHMMLARVLRPRGLFGESLLHSITAHEILSQFESLFFDEHLGDPVSNHADTLRELNDPWSAENMLRQEIALQDQSGVSSSKLHLQLSVAEALFAQERLEEAKLLCLYVGSRPDLLKLEKLRLHITMAKIHHIHAEYEEALPH